MTQLWSRAFKLAISGAQLTVFSESLIALRDEGKLSHPALDTSPPPPPTPPKKAKDARRLNRKLQVVDAVENTVEQLQSRGFHVIYTDGSAEILPGIGGIAGYGVYSECGLSISAFLPTDQRQTVNAAELFATIQALGATDSARVAICTDSSYVYGGATGSARRWKIRGLKNAKGVAVSNPALWDLLINELDRPGRIVQWVKIPSHVGIEGNVEADRLANLGRESSPLYPKHTTSGPASSHGTQPLRKKRRFKIENAPLASPFLTTDESLFFTGLPWPGATF